MKKYSTSPLKYLLWLVACISMQLPLAAKEPSKLHKPPKPLAATPLRIELIVRPVNNFTNPSDVVAFFNAAQRAKVTVVHLNIKQDEDDERPSGHVYYASRIAPVAAGYENFDVLASAIAEAHKRNIKVYAWMPQFHDQAAAKANPQWQMMAKELGRSVPFQGKGRIEYFVNPLDPGVQAYQKSLIEEVVKNYDIDGIALDWLRFDDLNMDTGPYTRQLAQQELGLDPMNIDFAQPSAERERWNNWRSQKIASYTQQVRSAMQAIKPHVKLAAFVLPPEFTEVGQNLAMFSDSLDEVMPMAYFEDWQFPTSWVSGRLMADVNRLKAKRTSIKPTLDGSGSTAQNIDILKAIRKSYPAVTSVVWFSAFYWQAQGIERIVHINAVASSAAQSTKPRY